jgi:transcriptional regulator with XRE-family HTH domain
VDKERVLAWYTELTIPSQKGSIPRRASAVPDAALNTEESKAFSLRLQQERKRLQLTQAQLADALGVSRVTLMSYEGGRSSPDVDTLFRGAKAVGLDLVFLTTGSRLEVGADAKWRLIPALLDVVKDRLALHGAVVSDSEEADILRELFLVLRSLAAQPSEERPAH